VWRTAVRTLQSSPVRCRMALVSSFMLAMGFEGPGPLSGGLIVCLRVSTPVLGEESPIILSVKAGSLRVIRGCSVIRLWANLRLTSSNLARPGCAESSRKAPGAPGKLGKVQGKVA
jgi:hypothetical protein